MNKQIIQSQSPYTLNLGTNDTSQVTSNTIELLCSGTGITVNLLPQAQIPGSPEVYITAAPAGPVTVNLGTGDVTATGGSNVTTFDITAGNSAILKPMGSGVWLLKK